MHKKHSYISNSVIDMRGLVDIYFQQFNKDAPNEQICFQITYINCKALRAQNFFKSSQCIKILHKRLWLTPFPVDQSLTFCMFYSKLTYFIPNDYYFLMYICKFIKAFYLMKNILIGCKLSLYFFTTDAVWITWTYMNFWATHKYSENC